MFHFRAHDGAGPLCLEASLAGLAAQLGPGFSPDWVRLRRGKGLCAHVAERASQPVDAKGHHDYPERDESCPKDREKHILTMTVEAANRWNCRGRPNSAPAEAHWRPSHPTPPR